MRRPMVIVLLLIMALAWIAPAYAQEGFGPEQQRALDEVHAALDTFTGADTYTAHVSQKVAQAVGIDFAGQSLLMDQTMSSTGSVQFEKMPENKYDNQQMMMTQTIQSVVSGAQSLDQTIGPIETQFIVVDDHVYLRVETPQEMQGFYPHGWQDVTEGADAFPGMSMLNIDNMISMGNIAGPEYTTDLLNAVRTVSILEPEPIGERTSNHYRLELDPRQALETIGAANLEQMFDPDQSPFDVAGFIELLFKDEDTRYDVDFLIFTDDQTLHSLSVHMTTDVDIPSSIMTDPSLSGAEMSFKQDVVQIVEISGTDIPVAIQTPELGQ
jgi:hypothetical protein